MYECIVKPKKLNTKEDILQELLYVFIYIKFKLVSQKLEQCLAFKDSNRNIYKRRQGLSQWDNLKLQSHT